MDPWSSSTERRALVALVAIKIAGIVLIFDPFALETFNLPKSLFSRAVAWVIAAVLLSAFVRYGRAILPRSPVHVAVGALLLVTALSGLFAEDPYLALYGDNTRYLGLTFALDMAVLYAAVSVAFVGVADFAAVAVLAGAAGVICYAYAVLQLTGHDPIRWTSDSRSRPWGTSGNPDTLGHVLSVVVGVALGIAVTASGARTWLLRAAAASQIATTILVAGFVATRGTLLGMAAAFLSIPVVLMAKERLDLRRVARGALLAILLLVMLVLAIAVTPLGARAVQTIEGVGTRDRIQIYQSALAASAARPVLGWGPDNFRAAYPQVRQASGVLAPSAIESSTHNWILQALVTTGVLGLAATFALIAVTIVALMRGLRRRPTIAAPLLMGMAGYWAHALVSVGTINVDWFPWFAAAGAVTIGRASDSDPTASRPLPMTLRVGLVAIGLALGSLGLSALGASVDAARASAANNRGLPSVALSSAKAAVAADGGRPQYWNLLGHAYDIAARWGDAASAYAVAARRAPYDAEYWANLARSRALQARGGDLSGGGSTAAIAAARTGVQADPNNPEPNAVLAEVLNAFAQPDEALRRIATAIALSPGASSYELTAVSAAGRASDLPSARAALERVIAVRDTAGLRVALAQVALRQDDVPAARSNATRALQLDPANADALRILASTTDR
jgi:O-antigen ligase/cytochrome c-type biogenesis protein CcmH/NrfG